MRGAVKLWDRFHQLPGICFLREAPEAVVGADRLAPAKRSEDGRAGKMGNIGG